MLDLVDIDIWMDKYDINVLDKMDEFDINLWFLIIKDICYHMWNLVDRNIFYLLWNSG